MKEGFVATPPVLGKDGSIYFGASEFRLISLSPDRSMKWELKHDGFMTYPPVIGSDGTLYFGTQITSGNKTNSMIYAVQENGSMEWSQKIKGGITSPVFSSDRIYVLTNSYSKGFENPKITVLAIGEKRKRSWF